jgi:hypothetical protein
MKFPTSIWLLNIMDNLVKGNEKGPISPKLIGKWIFATVKPRLT